MRNDTIIHSRINDNHYLTVRHSDKTTKEYSQIALSKNTGEGAEFKETTTAQPCIYIYGKELFNGSLDQLRDILQQAHEGKGEYQYKIGQPVTWSYGTKPDYFVIRRYNVGPDAGTGDNGNRYHLADKTGQLHINISENELLPY